MTATEMRNAKLSRYRRSMGAYKAFRNIFLPLMFISFLVSFTWGCIVTGYWDTFSFLHDWVRLIWVALLFFAVSGGSKDEFRLSVGFMGYMLLAHLVKTIRFIKSAQDIKAVATDAGMAMMQAAEAPIVPQASQWTDRFVDAIMSGFVGQMVLSLPHIAYRLAVFVSVVAYEGFFLLCAWYIAQFIRHKDFFYTDLHDMAYDDDFDEF